MERSRFCHLTVDSVQKEAYVWHEADWKFSDEWHSHHMGQLIFVEKGVQYLHTPDRTYLLPTHHCAWIPPGLLHKTSAPVSPVYLRCIFLSKTADSQFFKELNIFHTPMVLREMILFTEQWSRLEEEDALEFDFLKALIGILPLTFDTSLPLVLPVPQNPRIARMIDYLTENVANDIKIPDVAANFNLSARTMERLFKQDIGITVAGYIKLYKIIKAVELLSISGENVKSVAIKVGYDSVSTFSNTFFNVLGVRPQEMIVA
ncbi:AraC-like DNA-binding protein [Pedobacter cryoconitis]|uniref:AraC-like DNA-binding protein n=1 Tax=Pedobacter cryoconitis TaxID=188932 RepID=A0A7W8ZR88_9SPHI|nr:AraC family transcriptional regulator [Pedobacter cryoconitis]MBB5638748.1 AraC-like DNA-binding protein [Pedobacter cryoconitis]MBB6270241.1 AraC-like DNA-binding protein [Pedobacter cryoconitis]